ncbi:MAG: helix-turn-helix domain-containing protein [Candidatus Gastranaerophilaceae bacterium]
MNLMKNEQPYGKIIDAKSASKLLGVSLSYVYKMVERDRINCIKYPNAIRFFESDIIEFLNKHRVTAE